MIQYITVIQTVTVNLKNKMCDNKCVTFFKYYLIYYIIFSWVDDEKFH